MSDQELRALERAWRASGAPEDHEAWLQARARATGTLLPVLQTREALATRGSDWARARCSERGLWESGVRGDELHARQQELLREAYGPLAPNLDTVTLMHSFEDIFARAEAYARGLEGLCSQWSAPSGPSAAAGRARVWAELARITARATEHEEAWFGLIPGVVAQFCEIVGEPQPGLTEDLPEACFESWTLAPDQPLRFGNSLALARARDLFIGRYGELPEHRYPPLEWVAQVPAAPESLDAHEVLLPHLLATLSLDWSSPPPAVEAALEACALAGPQADQGAQERYQVQVDAPAHSEDPSRLQRFLRALALARRLADEEAPLGFESLQAVQRAVLAEEAPLRSRPALAKGGAEVYASFGFLPELIRRKLTADLRDEVHPIVQAGRLYLDLIYLHPFEDGNARAGLLGLELVLGRAGLPTPDLGPLVQLKKSAGDAGAYWEFVGALAEGVARARGVS